MCPYCKRNAPLVYHGLRATCSACGRARTPLSGSSLTHAGKPAEVAGTVMRVVGWVVLAIGLSISALIALFVGLIGSAGAGGVTFIVLALITLFAFGLSRMGGKGLSKSGEAARDRQREQALFALAANRGGRLLAYQAAQALEMRVEDADALLTHLAKTRGDEVDVEVGERGELYYVFPRLMAWAPRGPERVRIDTDDGRSEPDAREAQAEQEERSRLESEQARAERRRSR